jgi:hypothetical protein
MVLGMLLNEEYSFSDVRFLITSNPAYKRGYDAGKSFIGIPTKTRLDPGTPLFRLDFPVISGFFGAPWWMGDRVFQTWMNNTADATTLRREWQHQASMPKAPKGVRTLIVEIQLTAPVYAWVGLATGLFNRPGGAEQIYLPNLAKGTGLNNSNVARIRRTYTLPVL